MQQNRITVNRIPDHFLEWLAFSRIKFLEDMISGKPMRYFSAHLPVMSTWVEGEQFPVNMTVKGIGLIPSSEQLEHFTDVFESVIAEARSMPWQESLPRRVEVMTRLYSKADSFEPSLLGGLEIFEGRAFENLRTNPSTSLLYVGMSQAREGIQYVSFQVNGKVEILGKDNPYYRYLLAARKLFEFDRFHLYQPDYPFGYLIRVLEVKDKAPWSRGAKP